MRLLATLIVCILMSATTASAAPFAECVHADAVPEGTLKVAIRPAPPFVQNHPLRGLEGISIDLWKHIAQTNGYEFAYVCLNLHETLAALKDGSVDVAISPLTISAEREAAFDFSHQYFTSGLVFAGPPEIVSFDFERVLDTLLKALGSRTVVTSALIFLFAALIVAWVASRNLQSYKNPLPDSGSRPLAILHMFLFSTINLIGMRRDLFKFGAIKMQLMFLVVVFIGSVLSASLGGLITASFMHGVEQTRTIDPARLGTFTITTLRGSTAESYLQGRRDRGSGTPPHDWLTRDSWSAALDDILSKRANLVVGDWVQLVYLANTDAYRDGIQVYDQTLRFEPYGWGLPTGSPLRDPINQRMIQVLRSDVWPTTVRGYVGSAIQLGR